MPDTTPNVFQALTAARLEIGPIAKAENMTSTFGPKYTFRGIDTVVNAVAPVLARHGILVVPSVVKTLSTGQVTIGSKNTPGWLAELVITWSVYGPDGSTFTMETAGFSTDTSDKHVNKATSYAWRTALLQLLLIPTGDPDPDATADNNIRSGNEPVPHQQEESHNPDAPFNWSAWVYEATKGDRGFVADVLADQGWADAALPDKSNPVWEKAARWIRANPGNRPAPAEPADNTPEGTPS